MQQRASVEQAELNLQYATVKSPMRGIVSKKGVEVGQVIQPGQPLMTIIPLEEVWVTANFKETQLALMRVGQTVDVDVDACDITLHGKVQSIQRGAGQAFGILPPENATGNYVKVVQRLPVKIVFDEPPDVQALFAPGLSVVPEVKVR